MTLSADMFKQIVKSLKSDGPVEHSHEKREQGRVGLRSQLSIIPCEAGIAMKSHMVWVRDISANGMGLLSETEVKSGVLFAARFPRDGETPLTILYKVMYCRKMPGNIHSIGAKLDRIVAETAKAPIAPAAIAS